VGDRGIHHAFVLPVICYLYILLFAAKGQPKRVALRGATD
jgi:fucose permease